MFERNRILDVPLTSVLKPQIALSLQQVLRLYTVGNLLDLWQDPRDQRRIEQLFETSEQARHTISVCAAWLGFDSFVMAKSTGNAGFGDPWLAGVVTLPNVELGESSELDG